MRYPIRSCLLAVLVPVLLLAQPLAARPEVAPEFPREDFIQINPTLPNEQLDFSSDTNESCCAKDHPPERGGTKLPGVPASPAIPGVTAFELANPGYRERSNPAFLVECLKYETMPELAVQESGAVAAPEIRQSQNISSFSNNLSARPHQAFIARAGGTEPTRNFHVSAGGGQSLVRLDNVSKFSVCMARGNNVALVSNTDNGSILSYAGNDHLALAGHATNMLVRAGDGDDVIEVAQAVPNPDAATWSAHNIYKTALSGSAGMDTVVINGTPAGTKWCFIGGYNIFGEYFYVVEFALPPSVTQGPRRQRINIGRSVEYVVFKGRKYTLFQFMNHGTPVDVMARETGLAPGPIGAALPFVPVTQSR